MSALPDRARIVIIGGGVIGTSVAYHLTLAGETDVLLLEQGELSCGTTWHAAGLVGQLRATESGTRLVQYSTDLYSRLEDEIGLSAGFKRCGGRHGGAHRGPDDPAASHGRDRRGVRPGVRAPHGGRGRRAVAADVDVDDLVGAIWLPGDGKANPTDLTMALAKGARQRGARVVEHVRVFDVLTEDDAVVGVRTRATATWRPRSSSTAPASGPTTSPPASASPCRCTPPSTSTSSPTRSTASTPTCRSCATPTATPTSRRRSAGSSSAGSSPRRSRGCRPTQIPYPFEFQLLDEDWEHFSMLMDSAIERLPVLRETGIRKFYNGPESFTPDNQFILGEAPEVRGLLRRRRVQLGRHRDGGRGRSSPGRVDRRRRAQPRPAGRRHPPLRSVPRRQRVAARAGRRGARAALRHPVAEPRARDRPAAAHAPRSYERLAEANAGFGSKMGWERANFFAPAGRGPDDRVLVGQARTGSRGWRPSSGPPGRPSRCSTRPRSPSTWSPAPTPRPRCSGSAPTTSRSTVGRTVYTGLLNARGTYESDLTVTRVAADEFLLVSSSATTERDQDWIRRNIPDGLAGRHRRRHRRLRRLRRDGAELARAAVAPDRRRPERGRLPVRHQPRDRPGRRHRARHPDHLRRRARLGAVRADRVRARRVRRR